MTDERATLVNHALITRFNLPSAGPEGVIRAHEGWLTTRVGLFERYCVPAVRAQTNQNFRWLIYFDPESPTWLLERIAEYETSGIFRPILRAAVSHEQLVADVRECFDEQLDTLITTNLDNDDGLATDFIERLQTARAPHPRAALYLTNGLILSPDGLYLRRDRRNAFCSVRETWDGPATCWADWHTLLGDTMPVVELDGPPGWLQVVHGTNVSNRVRGKLVAPGPHVGAFGPVLGDVQVPTRRRMLCDRFVAVPARGAREFLRAGAKWAVIHLLGKTGVDRIKLRLIGARR